jgi:hypothetical protein
MRVHPALVSILALAAFRPVGEFRDLPVSFGAGTDTAGGATELNTQTNALALRTSLAAQVSSCASSCADVDQDGLVDAWEDLVLNRFRPVQRFDELEPLVTDPDAVLADVGRLTLVGTSPLRVRAFIMLGYSSDYGSCGISAHHGDSERVAVELDALPEGGGNVVLTRAYTAAHEGASTDHSHLYAGDALHALRYVSELPHGQPRWVVFPSSAKHGTYANPEQCERTLRTPCFAEFCNPDVEDAGAFDHLPPVFNAGEENAPRLEALDAIGFPGDHAWADQKFCGGLAREECSSAVREKLLEDPFE